MKQRQRRRVFNRTYIVKTLRITHDLAEHLKLKSMGEKSMYVCKTLKDFIKPSRRIKRFIPL